MNEKKNILYLRALVDFPQAISICHKNILNNAFDKDINVLALKTKTQKISNKKIRTINVHSNFLLRSFTSTLIQLYHSLKMDLIVGVGNMRELPIVYFAKLFNPKIKYLVEIHTCYERIQKNQNKGIFKKLKYSIFRHLINKSDKILTVSEFTKRGFVKGFNLSAEKMQVVHNSISTSLFSKNNRDLKKIREIFKIKNSKKNILYVGKLSKTKRPDIFLKIAKKLPNYNFIMVGKNIMNLNLKKINNVYHIEKLDRKTVSMTFASSDLFLFPSEVEPFGLVMIEAMASGLPVISTNGGAFPEIVTENVNGFLIAKNKQEVTEFVKKIRYVLEKVGIQAKFSKNSIKLSKKFDSKIIAKKHEKLHKEICNK